MLPTLLTKVFSFTYFSRLRGLFLSSTKELPLHYRQNYYFWFFHLGWAYLGLAFVWWLQLWWVSTTVVFIPLGCSFVYVLLYYPLVSGELFSRWRISPVDPGVAAVWLSLVSLLFVGTTCVTQLNYCVDLILGEQIVLDTLSVPFVLLTVTLAPLVVVASLDSIRQNQFWYYSRLLFLFGRLVLCFCVTHFLTFYILFEILGFPRFVLIGVYGPRTQRLGAAYKFFRYTFVGSAFILPVLVYFYFFLGSTHVMFLVNYQFTEWEQTLFFGLVSFPFAVKIPVRPVHLWLPEAHVEAPTPVSIILAALLLKTGGYAFIRFIVPVFTWGVYVWGPFLNTVGIFSVLFASLYALIQVDTKRRIAYASVAHRSLVFIGLFTGVSLSVVGGVYLRLAHGYISAGLFAGIGVLYDRYHTRTIRYLGGLATCRPLFSLFFFVLTLGNFSFPFTGGFVGEFILLLGITQRNLVVGLLAGSTVFLSLCYSAWLFNRVFYGVVNDQVQKHQDLTQPEVAVLGWCTFFTVALGFLGGWFCLYVQNSDDWLLRVTPG